MHRRHIQHADGHMEPSIRLDGSNQDGLETKIPRKKHTVLETIQDGML